MRWPAAPDVTLVISEGTETKEGFAHDNHKS